MRYECLGCDYQTDSEHDCWLHAVYAAEAHHDDFVDTSAALRVDYSPLLDIDVHIECGLECAQVAEGDF